MWYGPGKARHGKVDYSAAGQRFRVWNTTFKTKCNIYYLVLYIVAIDGPDAAVVHAGIYNIDYKLKLLF